MFSPGNLRATFDNAAYERLISFYVGEKYTLRYTGGMVPGDALSQSATSAMHSLEKLPCHPREAGDSEQLFCLSTFSIAEIPCVDANMVLTRPTLTRPSRSKGGRFTYCSICGVMLQSASSLPA